MVLKERTTVYFSLLEDVGVLQGEPKISQGADKYKKFCNSKGSSDMSVSYMITWDDPCDLARWVSRLLRKTKSLQATQAQI